MERPECQAMGTGMCKHKAKWIVVLLHDYKAKLACDEHRNRWNEKGGYACWIGELSGYLEGWSIEEVFEHNKGWAAKA